MLEENIQEEIVEEEQNSSVDEKTEHWYKGPIKIIMGLFLLLLIVLWLVPFYGIKQNPEPNYIPNLEELGVQIGAIPDISSNNIRDYIQISPGIKQLTDKIITLSCLQTHRICNAKALFYFVQKNFNYVNDPLSQEYYKTPQESLITKALDCDDYAVLLTSLLRAVGFQTRFVNVPRHIYLQVKIPEAVSSYKTEDNWINLDPTCKNCLFGETHYSYAGSQKQFLE